MVSLHCLAFSDIKAGLGRENGETVELISFVEMATSPAFNGIDGVNVDVLKKEMRARKLSLMCDRATVEAPDAAPKASLATSLAVVVGVAVAVLF